VTQQPYAPPQGQPPYGPPPTGQPYGQMPTGQMPYGQMPYGQPQAPTPEKKPLWKKTWFRVVAALFVIFVIAQAVNGGDDAATTDAAGASDAPAAADVAAPAEEAAPEEPAMPGIGQPAADGDFSFVVSGVDCSLTEVGNEYFGTQAQGQFCVVDVAVTNIGNEAGTFFGDNAKLMNAEGQEFSADTEAAIYLDDSDSLLEEINPGNTLNSKVVFDVPAGTTPATIELHDSAFSGGVTVALQ
jgi:Domain of unknown function (DUF4352)